MLFGILGMHRFYLGQIFVGVLLTGLFLAGVLLIMMEYYNFVTQMLGSVSALSGGQIDISRIPDSSQIFSQSAASFYWGIRMCAAAGIWWFVEMLFLPLFFKRYQEREASD